MEALASALHELEALDAVLDEGLKEHPPFGFRREVITAWTEWADGRERLFARFHSHEVGVRQHLDHAALAFGCASHLDALEHHAPTPVATIRALIDGIRRKSARLRERDARSREFLMRARLMVKGYLDAAMPRAHAYGRDGVGAPAVAPPTTSRRV